MFFEKKIWKKMFFEKKIEKIIFKKNNETNFFV